MTKYYDLFGSLASAFRAGEVKVRKQAGRDLHYVTARTVMNRLDEVLGPENWWDEYLPGEDSVLCRLTIRLSDGTTLTKSDAGGYAGMADSGDDDKSGYSDAFKRAAVKFGVARYLYRDGVPSFSAPVPAPAPARPAKPKATTRDERTCFELVRDGVEAAEAEFRREFPEAPRSAWTLTTYQVERHLLKIADGRPTEGMNNVEVRKNLEGRYASAAHRKGIRKELVSYLAAKSVEIRDAYAGEVLDAVGSGSADADPDCDYPDEPGSNG